MKITIELTADELDGIKKYLFDLEGRRAKREDVVQYVQGIVSTTLYSPQESVSTYISERS
jgi:hypothetical protein